MKEQTLPERVLLPVELALMSEENVRSLVGAMEQALNKMGAPLSTGFTLSSIAPAVLLFCAFKQGAITREQAEQYANEMSRSFTHQIQWMMKNHKESTKLH